MPKKSTWRHCETHGQRERFRMACTLCGRNDTCPDRPRPGGRWPVTWTMLCQTIRAELRRNDKKRHGSGYRSHARSANRA